MRNEKPDGLRTLSFSRPEVEAKAQKAKNKCDRHNKVVNRVSPRLSERLREFKDRSRKLVLEELCVYSAVILADILFDFICRLFDWTLGVTDYRPIHFGLAQWVVAGAFGILLIRKWQHWETLDD